MAWWYTAEKRKKEEAEDRKNSIVMIIGVGLALYFFELTFEGVILSVLWVFYLTYNYNSNLRTDRLHEIIKKLEEIIENQKKSNKR